MSPVCPRRPPGRPVALDPALACVVERHQREWYAFHEGVPGAEVHRDADLTWMQQAGHVWSNGGTSVRLDARTVGRRLDRILAHFRRQGRGVGLWVDHEATPRDLEDHLRARGLRCRKYYPGMHCDLARLPAIAVPAGITIRPLDDHAIYQRHPHPYFGRIRTPITRYELARLAHLAARRPCRCQDFVALAGDRPVGACTLFLSEEAAGFHDVGVLRSERGQGIGSALIAQSLRFARDHGRTQAVLLASGMGFNVYRRTGFRPVCEIGYWYRA